MHSYSLRTKFIEQWYEAKPWGALLAPFSKLFALAVRFRKYLYAKNIFHKYKSPVPVIIVGNITVGGTGKTPMVIYLSQLLRKHGYKPGIVTRGYKGKLNSLLLVSPYSDPKIVSDEAVLLANRSGCLVMVAKKRALAIQQLVAHHGVDVILCDDGLQHYAIERDIEIAVVDGKKRFGNGHSLPRGPLREPESRLNAVDLIVVNGEARSEAEVEMRLNSKKVYSLTHPQRVVDLDYFKGKLVHAIAGIGFPEKFFQHLIANGINVLAHPFPDHHVFSTAEIDFTDTYPILMTEKDAVKCKHFANSKHWVVAIDAVLPSEFDQKILSLVKERKHAR